MRRSLRPGGLILHTTSRKDPEARVLYFRTLMGMLLLLFTAMAYIGYIWLQQGPTTRKPAEVFSEIYAKKIWGTNAEGNGHSGSGSTLEATVVYRAYLQNFLHEHRIRSVVDAGCGDWESTTAIDWTGVEYKGYDIVEAVIAKNKMRFSAPNIQFFLANIVDADLPPADLLICKHVLQHLPNSDIMKFLIQLSKYRHVLLVNGVDPNTMSAENHDIPMGKYRPLDMTREPFRLAGTKACTYWDGTHMHQILHVR